MSASDYAFFAACGTLNALCVIVNLIFLGLNIKLYTEGMKDRNMNAREKKP